MPKKPKWEMMLLTSAVGLGSSFLFAYLIEHPDKMIKLAEALKEVIECRKKKPTKKSKDS